MLLNCGVGENSWESIGLQGDQTHQSYRKSTLNTHWEEWSWSSNTLSTWCEELTHWKRPWCWERLKAGEEGDDRGWDGWMASLTWWTWVWVGSWSWWWTGKPGVLQSMGPQRVRHNQVTELNWTDLRVFTGKMSPPRSPGGHLGFVCRGVFSVCVYEGLWHSGPFQSLLEKSLSGLGQGVRCFVYWAEERRVPTWPVGSGIRSKWILYTFLEGLRQCQCLRVCRPLKALILCV